MNAKQSLKIVAQKLEDAVKTLQRAQKDIKAYNECIDHMIAGGSPCDFCEDGRECHLEDQGKGCGLWMLRYEEEDHDKHTDIGTAGRAG